MIMESIRRQLQWMLVLSAFVNHAVADLSTIVDVCCGKGTDWAKDESRCDNYPSAVGGVRAEDQPMCLTILEVCCLKSKQNQMCSNGKSEALNNNVSLCIIRDDVLGAVTYKECCHCCRMGVQVKTMGMACTSPAIGNPCDAKFMECCTSTPTASNSTDPAVDDFNECEAFGDSQICSQICINTIGSFKCACNPGYQLGSDGTTCFRKRPDVPKCAADNKCSQDCVSTSRGPICTCRTGYILQRDRTTCVDIDECRRRMDNCSRTERCENTEGAFRCVARDSPSCQKGYVFDATTQRCVRTTEGKCPDGFAFSTVSLRCEDIDECIVQTDDCSGDHEMCENTMGSYYCSCDDGYHKDRLTKQCKDIDECARQMDTCTASERCENTQGSYACRRITPCGTGWTLDQQTQQCIDQNECELGTHNCGAGYQCFNIEGSFRCNPKTCPNGLRFSSKTGKCERVDCPRGLKSDGSALCIDIDECTEQEGACRRFQTCVNSYGSYRCVNSVNCGPGYEVGDDGQRCVDIDECAAGTHDCAGGASCINRQGSYVCACPTGFRRINGACVDKDECQYGSSCPFNSKCVNTEGSFQCVCNPGLEKRGRMCVDIDECQSGSRCQHRCVNIVGSYHCTCNSGYELASDKRSCVDIDECQKFGGRGRLCGGTCINTQGSYRCTCPEGWRVLGNGRSCQDVDECALNQDRCGNSPDVMCFNTRGSHKCPRVTCPSGFSRSSLGPRRNSVRCKRLSFTCRQGDEQCLNAPLSLSYNFLTFPTNVKIPTEFFSMSGPRTRERLFNWHLNVTSAYPAHTGIQKATRSDFKLRIRGNEAVVILDRSVEGPQDIELQLTMEITDQYSGYTGRAYSKIFLYVTSATIG